MLKPPTATFNGDGIVTRRERVGYKGCHAEALHGQGMVMLQAIRLLRVRETTLYEWSR